MYHLGAMTSANINWVIDTFLSALYVITYLILITALWGWAIIISLNNEEAEVSKVQIIYLRWHS